MIKIAVLDDGINAEFFNRMPILHFYQVCNSHIRLCSSENTLTHGTICSKIISEKIFNDIEIFSIKVKSRDRNGYIEDLACGLNFCINKNFDIINISLGTTDSNDKIYLEHPIKQLVCQNTIIVCAVSNKGGITYPAHLPNMIAVNDLNTQCMNRKKQPEDMYVSFFPIIEKNPDESLIFKPCNSFSAAFVTNRVAAIMRDKKHYSLDEIRSDLSSVI